MKKLKKIQFVLENCEVLELDSYYVSKICFIGLQKSIDIHRTDVYHNTFCKSAVLSFKNLNKGIHYSNKDINKTTQDDYVRNTYDAYKRIIDSKDIASIVLVYTNGYEEHIYVPWGKKDFINTFEDIIERQVGNDMMMEITFNFKWRHILYDIRYMFNTFYKRWNIIKK